MAALAVPILAMSTERDLPVRVVLVADDTGANIGREVLFWLRQGKAVRVVAPVGSHAESVLRRLFAGMVRQVEPGEWEVRTR